MINTRTLILGGAAAVLAMAGIGAAIAHDGKVKVKPSHAKVHTHARGATVDAPYTDVDVDGGNVEVNAPYTHVKRGKKGVRVVAPYVNIWVPTR